MGENIVVRGLQACLVHAREVTEVDPDHIIVDRVHARDLIIRVVVLVLAAIQAKGDVIEEVVLGVDGMVTEEHTINHAYRRAAVAVDITGAEEIIIAILEMVIEITVAGVGRITEVVAVDHVDVSLVAVTEIIEIEGNIVF